MEGTEHPLPRTEDEVFNDFKGRRAGLIKALTTDVKEFERQCASVDQEALCLYGLPNETWKVGLPDKKVPPELPNPMRGINFLRDGIEAKNWLSFAANYSDAWLISVANYFGWRCGIGKSERSRLFQMINEQPTIFEAVTGAVKPAKDQASTQNNGRKNTSSGRMMMSTPKDEDESGGDEEEDEQGATSGASEDIMMISGLAGMSVKDGSMGNA